MNKKIIELKTAKERKKNLILQALNGFLNLTPKELRVVEYFLQLNKEFPCGASERKKVCELMGIKNVQSLNNIIRSITKKKVFILNNGRYEYNSLIKNLDVLNKIEIYVEDI